jgi:hypothetical protein
MPKTQDRIPDPVESDFDLDSLLHPAQAFDHPMDVVRDADLTLNEKRAILASWASDACAVESEPTLRQAPNGRTVTFDDVVDALRSLDGQIKQARVKPERPFKRALRAWRTGRGEGDGDGGIGLH